MKELLALIFLMGSFAARGAEFVDSPRQCYQQQKYPCQMHVSGGFLEVERGPQKFHLGEGSSLLFLSENRAQLLKGEIWVIESEHFTLRASPNLEMRLSGQWLLQKQSDASLLVRNLDGEIEFQSKNIFASEALPVGFQNWYSTLDTSGQISRGVIRPVVWAEFLKSWLPLSGQSLAQAKKQVAEYRDKWQGALESSSRFYQEVIERRLASLEQRDRRWAEQKRAQAQEQQRLHQMYRERNGLLTPHGPSSRD